MARSTSPDIRLQFGQGSPLVDITQWIISDIALGDEGIYVDGTAYSMTHVVNLPVGVADQADVTLEGFFDDDDDGPFDLFGTISTVNTPPYTLTSDLDGGIAGLNFDVAVSHQGLQEHGQGEGRDPFQSGAEAGRADRACTAGPSGLMRRALIARPAERLQDNRRAPILDAPAERSVR